LGFVKFLTNHSETSRFAILNRRNGVKKVPHQPKCLDHIPQGLVQIFIFSNDKNVGVMIKQIFWIYETVLIEEAGDVNENYLPYFKKFYL
jgi:hypothetical protein